MIELDHRDLAVLLTKVHQDDIVGHFDTLLLKCMYFVVFKVHSFPCRQIYSIQILVLLDAKCIFNVVIVAINFIVVKVVLLQHY